MAAWDAWFPFYVGDYLAATQRLTAQEHGTYVLLILDGWMNGPPPDDPATLAKIARATPEEWAKLDPAMRPFFKIRRGRWIHTRIEVERKRAQNRYESAAKNGSLGGLKKQLNHKLASDPTFSLVAKRYRPPEGADVPERAPEIPKHVPCPHAEILALWAEVLPELPRHDPHQWHETRRAHLQARWRETAVLKGWKSPGEGLAYLRALFAFIGTSKFLTGKVPARGDAVPFMAELEWVAKRANWAKIIEGKYHQEVA